MAPASQFALLALVAASAVDARALPQLGLQRGRELDGRRELRAPAPALRRALELRGGARASVAPKSGGLLGTLKLGLLFGAWYGFNIWYSLVAKMVLQWWQAPWLFTILQLGIGSLWVGAQWLPLPTLGLRKERFASLRAVPRLSRADLVRLLPIAACLAAGHLASTMAMFHGTVAFANVVKTAEPLFTCLFGALLVGQIFSPRTYATLIPIMGGVAYASAAELSFSWASLLTAMSSNVAFALRATLAKQAMQRTGGAQLSAADLFAVVNLLAFLLLLPLALLIEARGAGASWAAALARGVSARELTTLVGATGVSYYLYNELAFMCLGTVDPVTHAVANTAKRVVVIGVSIVFFENPITRQGVLGSAVAVLGVLLYSLALGAENSAKAAAASLGAGKRSGKCTRAAWPKGKACPKKGKACPASKCPRKK